MLLGPAAFCVAILLAVQWMRAPSTWECVAAAHELRRSGDERPGFAAGQLSCSQGLLTLLLLIDVAALSATHIAAALAAQTARRKLDSSAFCGMRRRGAYAVDGTTRRLSLGWRQHTSSDGRVFYSHPKSGRVQWTAPAELDQFLRPLETVPEGWA
eukprot:scaffold3293_cov32-Tisochrysis_lutea.AAC.3